MFDMRKKFWNDLFTPVENSVHVDFVSLLTALFSFNFPAQFVLITKILFFLFPFSLKLNSIYTVASVLCFPSQIL